ncbi:hypothetical protein HK101_002886 [Irineochytrium annulatum]|nr:hypothetical protein HK101_002886 [Irineochytrium annulatum]
MPWATVVSNTLFAPSNGEEYEELEAGRRLELPFAIPLTPLLPQLVASFQGAIPIRQDEGERESFGRTRECGKAYRFDLVLNGIKGQFWDLEIGVKVKHVLPLWWLTADDEQPTRVVKIESRKGHFSVKIVHPRAVFLGGISDTLAKVDVVLKPSPAAEESASDKLGLEDIFKIECTVVEDGWTIDQKDMSSAGWSHNSPEPLRKTPTLAYLPKDKGINSSSLTASGSVTDKYLHAQFFIPVTNLRPDWKSAEFFVEHSIVIKLYFNRKNGVSYKKSFHSSPFSGSGIYKRGSVNNLFHSSQDQEDDSISVPLRVVTQADPADTVVQAVEVVPGWDLHLPRTVLFERRGGIANFMPPPEYCGGLTGSGDGLEVDVGANHEEAGTEQEPPEYLAGPVGEAYDPRRRPKHRFEATEDENTS